MTLAAQTTFREVVLHKLVERLSVDEGKLDAILENIDNEQADAVLELNDQLSEIADKVDLLEGENGSEIVSAIRQVLVSSGGNFSFDDIGISDLHDTLILSKLANSVPSDFWSTEVALNDPDLKLSSPTLDTEFWDVNGKEITAFASPCGDTPSRSLAYFKFKPIADQSLSSDIENEITEHGLSDDGAIKVRIISLLFTTNSPLSGQIFVVCNKVQKKMVCNALKYHIVMRGHLTSQPISMTQIDGISSLANHIVPSRKFEQMDEPLSILSEINARQTVLEKFLSAYHSLENYMLRKRLVDIESRRDGGRFRISDFKLVGNLTDDSEANHLSALLNDLWDTQVGDETLIDFAESRRARIFENDKFHEADFSSLIENLNNFSNKKNPKKFSDADELRKNFSAFLYKCRCAVVHHKVTEYHISNSTLKNDTVYLIFRDFLIPIMAQIAFGLPILRKENPLIYNSRNLVLY